MSYIFTSKLGRHADMELCREAVLERGRGSWARYKQCNRKGAVCRDIGGTEYKFCKQHDPEAIKARNEERTNQWRAEQAEKNREYQRQVDIKVATEACVHACRMIAADCTGYAQHVAMNALNKFPEKQK